LWKKFIPLVLVIGVVGGLVAYGVLRGLLTGVCPCPNCREKIYGPGKCLLDFTVNFCRLAFPYNKKVEVVDPSGWKMKELKPDVWKVEGKFWVIYSEFREVKYTFPRIKELYRVKELYEFYLIAERLPDKNWKAIEGDANVIRKTAEKVRD